MSNTQSTHVPPESLPAPMQGEVRVLLASSLFGNSRTVAIEHEGERYVLRITRNDRLILTK